MSVNDWPFDELNLPWNASTEHSADHNVYVYGGDGDAVITVEPHVMHDQLAIARLAAAAPTLLAALRQLVEASQDYDASSAIREALKPARAVIARVEGGGEQ